jgi:hypothetical protein
VLNDTKLILWDGEENHLDKVSVQSVSYLLQKKKMPIEEEVLPSGAEIK